MRILLNWLLGVAIGYGVTTGVASLALGYDAGVFAIYGAGLGGTFALASDVRRRFGFTGCLGAFMLVMGLGWPMLSAGHFEPLNPTHAGIMVVVLSVLLVCALNMNLFPAPDDLEEE